jgi:hypothetical protein
MGMHENYAEQICGAVFMLILEGEGTNLSFSMKLLYSYT